MERILNEIRRHTQNIKVKELTETTLNVTLSYIDNNSNYGNKGFISIEAKKDGNTYKLEITRQSPMGTNSVLCSYGRRYASTNGYGIGYYDFLPDYELVIHKIYKTLSAYKFY